MPHHPHIPIAAHAHDPHLQERKLTGRPDPAELAFDSTDIELVIERVGDELRIRPARRRIGNVMGALSRFSPGFMGQGRGQQEQSEREAL